MEGWGFMINLKEKCVVTQVEGDNDISTAFIRICGIGEGVDGGGKWNGLEGDGSGGVADQWGVSSVRRSPPRLRTRGLLVFTTHL